MSWEEHVAAETAKCEMNSERDLKKAAEQMKSDGLKVSYEILMGDPATEIIDYASRSNFSLIVMATHARSGFSRWAFGSVAEKVLLGVTTPILLVRNK
jgi:nucleotide-binding universal stress UspA family protein